ncbi:AbrB/MazE/SpoVT family DNA-binding domain-containing protein [Lactobacillus gigeriorum]|uniref:Toxin-antitoxin system n=1 Tax=Lactobacillus gigeriorum DSM 23908 = CRBIP 24.85 TaxID=1423751 RepID=I7KNY5_9LACO|nr:AbrB/MazE/SpoVT family DNA-binding domain-containing protein [Lactobacillus gigeriorum]CCI86994.1 Toxin-antitoxin system [Lactobacillus gigeriorum DSM 23908 = CRBIP 24.85]
MCTVKLSKWGNSNAIRIPKEILTKAGINDPFVEFLVTVDKDKIILEKKRKPQNLKELFSGFDYKKYWEEERKNAKGKSLELDWGKPVGKEVF